MMSFDGKVNGLILILVEIEYLMSPKPFITAMQKKKDIGNNQFKDHIFLCLVKS